MPGGLCVSVGLWICGPEDGSLRFWPWTVTQAEASVTAVAHVCLSNRRQDKSPSITDIPVNDVCLKWQSQTRPGAKLEEAAQNTAQ